MKEKRITLFTEQVIKNKLPCNIVEQDINLFEKSITEKLPESYYWQLNNALVLKDTVFRNFKFWQSYSQVDNLGVKSKFKRLLLNLFKKKKIEKGVWIMDSWSIGYFHWFADALPRLEAVKHYLSDHVVLLPEKSKSVGFVTQSLELLNQPYVFLNDRIPIRVKELILTSHITNTGNFNPEIIRSLRKKYLGNEELVKPFRKIFISRQERKHEGF